MSSNPFSAAERRAWEPPEELTTTEWALRYRILGAQIAAEPGPYRVDRVPYAQGIMDALSDPAHLDVAVMKCVQCGGSELGRNWLGRSVDVDPGPTMIVFPTEKSARENMSERVIPMFRDSPRLRRHFTRYAWDVRKGQLDLVPCSIYTGWAGSPQVLASRPIRYLFLDEVDKYKAYTGKESSSEELATDRTLTFRRRRKVYRVSTPTVPEGPIARAYRNAGDRRAFHVPCVKCDHLIKPDLEILEYAGKDADNEDQLRQARMELESDGAVYAVCPECTHKHTHEAWLSQVRRGQWVSEGYPAGEHPPSDSVAFHIHGLLSPWIGPRQLAFEHVSARIKGIAELQNFYNAFLGLPFWDSSEDNDSALSVGPVTLWEKKQAGLPMNLIPRWAQLVLCGADTRRDGGHYFVVRAWGEGYRSRLISFGAVDSSEELYNTVFRPWPIEGGRGSVLPRLLCVDSHGGHGIKTRSISDAIYRWCKTDPVHLRAVRGSGGSGEPLQPVVTTTRTYHPPGDKQKWYDVTVSTIDTNYFKDLLASRICNEDPNLWEIHSNVDQDYIMQVASERKIMIETRIRNGQRRDIWRWVPRVAHGANHYWDAEVYCSVAAYMADMDQGRDAVQDIRTRGVASRRQFTTPAGKSFLANRR